MNFWSSDNLYVLSPDAYIQNHPSTACNVLSWLHEEVELLISHVRKMSLINALDILMKYCRF